MVYYRYIVVVVCYLIFSFVKCFWRVFMIRRQHRFLICGRFWECCADVAWRDVCAEEQTWCYYSHIYDCYTLFSFKFCHFKSRLTSYPELIYFTLNLQRARCHLLPYWTVCNVIVVCSCFCLQIWIETIQRTDDVTNIVHTVRTI